MLFLPLSSEKRFVWNAIREALCSRSLVKRTVSNKIWSIGCSDQFHDTYFKCMFIISVWPKWRAPALDGRIETEREGSVVKCYGKSGNNTEPCLRHESEKVFVSLVWCVSPVKWAQYGFWSRAVELAPSPPTLQGRSWCWGDLSQEGQEASCS